MLLIVFVIVGNYFFFFHSTKSDLHYPAILQQGDAPRPYLVCA